MDGPVVAPDHTHLLARRAVEDEQGLPPQPVISDHPRLRLALTAVIVLAAIASVAVVVAALL